MPTAPNTGASHSTPITITTTVQDPNNPGEPWVVTTVQNDDEPIGELLLRHKMTVDVVRKYLHRN